MFVDESGDHGLPQNSDDRDRYFGLMGIWFQVPNGLKDLNQEMGSFKQSIFGPEVADNVVLHRRDIIDRVGHFRILNDQQKRRDFDEGILRIMADLKFMAVIIAIDKKAHFQNYETPSHVYHYCMTTLMERYCLFLNERKVAGDIVAESRGKADDRALCEAYSSYYWSGSHFIKGSKVRDTLTTKSLKCKSKKHMVPGLELVDLMVQPMTRWILHREGLGPAPSSFSRDVCDIVQTKLRDRKGETKGYGWKLHIKKG